MSAHLSSSYSAGEPSAGFLLLPFAPLNLGLSTQVKMLSAPAEQPESSSQRHGWKALGPEKGGTARAP